MLNTFFRAVLGPFNKINGELQLSTLSLNVEVLSERLLVCKEDSGQWRERNAVLGVLHLAVHFPGIRRPPLHQGFD